MNKKIKTSRFYNLSAGLAILNDYSPDIVNFEPVPAGFPNGAPDFSRSAYLAIHIKNWPVNSVDSKRLKELNWIEDDGAGEWFTFK